MVSGVADIRESLRILLGTAQGERIMLPGYGCDLWQSVFRDLTTTLATELKDMVQQAIVLWEPRIDVLSIDVSTDPVQEGVILIDVSYVVRATNTRDNLVYPFATREATLVSAP
jgi:hypothetical protein